MTYDPSMAEAAWLAYRAGDSDWRNKWSECLFEICLTLGSEDDSADAPQIELTQSLAYMLAEVATMLVDAERGALHPLATIPFKTGRKPKNAPLAEADSWGVTVIGLVIVAAAEKGEGRETAFRHAARIFTSAGCKMTWQECRSLWSNRKRSDRWSVTEEHLAVLIAGRAWEDNFLRAMADEFVKGKNQNPPML